MSETFDAIVIGAGEAGTEVASRAVAAGRRVAMIYRRLYGSTCLNTGCVPSKFMIHRARIAHLARTAGRYHVRTSEPQVDLAGIVREKDALIEENRAQAYEGARQAENLTLIGGEAHFRSPEEVAVGDWTLQAGRIFIATGMRPHIPPIEGLDRVAVLTNESLMELTELPRHLLIVGGGYIACELGQTFRRYGAAVTIVQSAGRLLPRAEPDVSAVLAEAFAAEGIALVLGYRAKRVEASPGCVQLTARADDGGERVVEGTHLFVAAGRRPNTDTLCLEAAGIEADEKGFVRVDDELRASVSGIWAIGDVNGQQPFTRVCQEEGRIAYANAFEDAHLTVDRLSLGEAVFTEPEIGSVGLTEAEARRRGYDVAAGVVDFGQVAKAKLIGETRGLIKYVVDRVTHRLLGCHVIGPAGADLVYDAVIVMRHHGTLDELADAVGIFPTLQEGMEGTARSIVGGLPSAAVAGPRAAAFAHQQGERR